MSEYYRCIGIDVGSKRVGLARSDLLRTVANPIGTYPTGEVFRKLEDIIEEENVRKFIVGWPLTPRGEEGEATKGVDMFINKLQTRFPDMEVVRVDERYTSKEAVKIMVRAGRSQKERTRRGRIDQAAAAIILQKYLDRIN